MSKKEEGRAAISHHSLGSPSLGPAPHHPANIPGECHPLACPLLLGAGAAATQRKSKTTLRYDYTLVKKKSEILKELAVFRKVNRLAL